jgi:hypothetical protein
VAVWAASRGTVLDRMIRVLYAPIRKYAKKYDTEAKLDRICQPYCEPKRTTGKGTCLSRIPPPSTCSSPSCPRWANTPATRGCFCCAGEYGPHTPQLMQRSRAVFIGPLGTAGHEGSVKRQWVEAGLCQKGCPVALAPCLSPIRPAVHSRALHCDAIRPHLEAAQPEHVPPFIVSLLERCHVEVRTLPLLPLLALSPCRTCPCRPCSTPLPRPHSTAIHLQCSPRHVCNHGEAPHKAAVKRYSRACLSPPAGPCVRQPGPR